MRELQSAPFINTIDSNINQPAQDEGTFITMMGNEAEAEVEADEGNYES